MFRHNTNCKSKWWNDTDKRCLKCNCKDRWGDDPVLFSPWNPFSYISRMEAQKVSSSSPLESLSVFHLVSLWWYASPVHFDFGVLAHSLVDFPVFTINWDLFEQTFHNMMHAPSCISAVLSHLEVCPLHLQPCSLFPFLSTSASPFSWSWSPSSVFSRSSLLCRLASMMASALVMESRSSLSPTTPISRPVSAHVRQAYVVRVFPNLIDRMKVNHAMKWSIQG